MSAPSQSYKVGLYKRLASDEEALCYLETALEDSQEMFLLALRNVVHARGFSSVARAAELNREHLYRVLSVNGDPKMSSILKVLGALGLQLNVSLPRAAKQDGAAGVWVSSSSFPVPRREKQLQYSRPFLVPPVQRPASGSGELPWLDGAEDRVSEHPAFAFIAEGAVA